MSAKVIVGMSGGVDSSVAAWLLQKQGYTVEGLFMKNWEQDDTANYCAAAEDLADAQTVCQQLGIPLHKVNFSQQYWQLVFTHFLNEYEQGRTPNPDVLCNKEIKFKAFLKHALSLGADYIATGHYARISQKSDFTGLIKGKDPEKDQTYFLHAIDPKVLTKTLFPVGEYYKAQVREFAAQLGLINHNKKDSTGICFIGEKKFKQFLQEYLLNKPGEIRSTMDKLLGTHDGLMFYTLGQRQGLGIGGTGDGSEDPWYVVEKDIKNNCLIIAQGKNHPFLFSKGLICGPIHWLVDYRENLPLTCYAKTRYRQVDQACILSGADNQEHYVMFANLQRAITPGQYIVFYEKNLCLGGAIIKQIIR